MEAKTPPRLRIALVANSSWYLHNFRPTLMSALHAEGHEVFAVAPKDDYSNRLTAAGFAHRHLPLHRTSLNPIRAAHTILHLRWLLRDEQIDTVLSFTPKGNVYSGLAITDPGVTFIANLSGLGRSYSKAPWRLWASMTAFRRALFRATAVFFQNGDDLKMMVDNGIVASEKARRLPGSGVDLQKFRARGSPVARHGDELVFLLVARLLRQKGIAEFAEAARRLKARCPRLRFRVLGPLEEGPAGLPRDIIQAWVRDGTIEYLGVSDDVRPHMETADCIVLPTYYREGVPRSLLEAAAMARPVIATDVAGCRDAVTDGETGFLCMPENVDALVETIERFRRLPSAVRLEMGRRGRAKMEAEFDETFVVSEYLDLVSPRYARFAASTTASGAAKVRPFPRTARR